MNRLKILREQEAARLRKAAEDAFYVAQTRCSVRFRDDPVYRAAVAAFGAPAKPPLRHGRPAAPAIIEYTVAPAGNPAEAQLDAKRAGTGPHAVKAFEVGDKVRAIDVKCGENRKPFVTSLLLGCVYTVEAIDAHGGLKVVEGGAGYWAARRFELDTRANPVPVAAAPSEHSYMVCVEDYTTLGGPWKVGEVIEGSAQRCRYPARWRDCDKDGWVLHTPRADSVCPVPVGVDFHARRRSGGVVTDSVRARGAPDLWRSFENMQDYGPDYVAWRPVRSKAAV